jgi:hypothetical protein
MITRQSVWWKFDHHFLSLSGLLTPHVILHFIAGIEKRSSETFENYVKIKIVINSKNHIKVYETLIKPVIIF